MKFITITLLTTIAFGICFFIGTCFTIGMCLLVNAILGTGVHYIDLIQSGLVLTIGFAIGCAIFFRKMN